ncbi:MAG: YqaA family protein [Arcobacter sp.]|uniref:YqaA family protein n=1 Tax=Arcobacter sp. TaxID=1872629 RepID=UPI003AFF656F
MIYLTLLFSSFISATLFPLGSEALLVYNILEGYNIYLLLFVATFGNSMGACLNYYLGLKGEEYLENKNIISKKSLSTAKGFFDKYGAWSLLLSWVPFIGDPITFIAGVLKFNFKYFLLLVIIAKFSRYAILVYITLS